MKISKKLSGGFSIILLLIIIVAFFANRNFTKIDKGLEIINSLNIPLLLSVNKQATTALTAHSSQKDFFAAVSADKRTEFRDATLARLTEIEKLSQEELSLVEACADSTLKSNALAAIAAIQTKVKAFKENFLLLADQLAKEAQENEEEETLLTKTKTSINLFIEDKMYANKDSVTILDALKNINITQLQMRLLGQNSLYEPEKNLDTLKTINSLATTLLEESEKISNLLQDGDQIKAYSKFLKIFNNYPILIKKFFDTWAKPKADPAAISAIKKEIAGQEKTMTESLAEYEEFWNSVKSENSKIITMLESLAENIESIRSFLSKYLKTGDSKQLEKLEKKITVSLKETSKLKSMTTSELESTTAEQISSMLNAFQQGLDDWLSIKNEIEHNTTRKLNTITTEVITLLNEKVQSVENHMSSEVGEMKDFASTSTMVVITATAAAILFGIIISIVLIINITRPINVISARFDTMASSQDRLVAFMSKKLASGDWSEYCDIVVPQNEIEILGRLSRRNDEIGKMSTESLTITQGFAKSIEAINIVIEQINTALSSVRHTVGDVRESSSQIDIASESLSTGAEVQSSSISTVSAAVIELKELVNSNRENARITHSNARDTQQSCNDCTSKMADLLSKINTINAASSEITKIIKTIDDIAFQTNLLALNAAVEAARAGMYGKGFAVVAEEVRNLASRSGKAASETSSLIEKVVKDISESNAMAGLTAEVLGEINERTNEVSTLAETSEEGAVMQAESIEKISASITEVSSITDENRQNAANTAQAAEELETRSQELKESIDNFTLISDLGGYDDKADDDEAADRRLEWGGNEDSMLLGYEEE